MEMEFEGLTIGGSQHEASENSRYSDFDQSCVSLLDMGFDPTDDLSITGSSAHSMQSISEESVLEMDMPGALLTSEDDDEEDSEDEFACEDDNDDDSSSDEEEDQTEQKDTETQVEEEPRRKRGFLARMASNDSLFGAVRPPRQPSEGGTRPRRGFLARMGSSDSLFGGMRGPPKNPAEEGKPSRRNFLSRKGSSDSLFGGISFGKKDHQKPHGSKTRRGGRRNRGNAQPEEEKEVKKEPVRGVRRLNTGDSLVGMARRVTLDSRELKEADKATPQPARTRRGGRRNRGEAAAEETPSTSISAPPQRGVARNNTSDSLVQSNRTRRGGRRNRPAQPPQATKSKDSLLDYPTEGESASESSTLLEMSGLVEA